MVPSLGAHLGCSRLGARTQPTIELLSRSPGITPILRGELLEARIPVQPTLFSNALLGGGPLLHANGSMFEMTHEAAVGEPQALARVERVEVDRKGVQVASLEAFVFEHYPRLVRLAGLITRDVDQAQDAVQAALERAWRKRDDVRSAAALRPWLDRIVVREAIRQTRGGPIARLLRGESTDWIDVAANLPEPTERMIVREAVGRLSPDHRAVVALHLYAGYSVDETARMLQVPFDTVRSRLRAARERLRRQIAEVTP